jgi:hypothetical protein
VYLMFPMWPYQVAAWVSLDGNPPLRVDLHDRTSAGTEGGRASRASSVLASSGNMDPNVEHTLVISTRPDEQFVVLDRIMCVFSFVLRSYELSSLWVLVCFVQLYGS